MAWLSAKPCLSTCLHRQQYGMWTPEIAVLDRPQTAWTAATPVAIISVFLSTYGTIFRCNPWFLLKNYSPLGTTVTLYWYVRTIYCSKHTLKLLHGVKCDLDGFPDSLSWEPNHVFSIPDQGVGDLLYVLTDRGLIDRSPDLQTLPGKIQWHKSSARQVTTA